MSFSADWLALRRAADSRARADTLAQAVGQWLRHHDDPARRLYLDLGSGSGANCLHLCDQFDTQRDWLLIDHDATLLDQAQRQCSTRAAVRTLHCDLAGSLAVLPWSQAAVVTASALLDLVSASWLTQLATLAAAQRLPVLLALSYDGRIALHPQAADDAWLCRTVNTHQRGNKGFGTALGPDAADHCAQLLRDHGYWVQLQDSDWLLDARHSADAALLRPLLNGWAEAAAETEPAQQACLTQWLQQRLAEVDQGNLQVRVGHQDLLALPPPA